MRAGLGRAIIPHWNGATGETIVPTLEFKVKQHIYAHYLTVLYAPIIPNPNKSVNAEKVAVRR